MKKNEKLLEIHREDMNTLMNRNIKIQQIVDILTTITEKYKRKASLIGDISINHCSEYSPEIKKHHDEELLRIDPEIFFLGVNSGYKNDMNALSLCPIIIDERYLITMISYWGFQSCPFVCFSEIGSRSETGGGDDYWIYDLETRKTLQFNDLIIHLIGDHHFFEGDVFHRLNPDDVINFFNLQPGIDYSNEFVEVDRWTRLDVGGDISPCYKFGLTNEMIVTRKDETTLVIECTQRDISQKSVGYISPEERKEEIGRAHV